VVEHYRTLSDERNGADQRALAAELKLSEMLTQINSILLVDAVSAVTHERTLNAVSLNISVCPMKDVSSDQTLCNSPTVADGLGLFSI